MPWVRIIDEDASVNTLSDVNLTLTNGHIATIASGELQSIARNSITLDEWGNAAGNLNIGGNRITNMADGTADTDAITLQQLTAVQRDQDWKESVVTASSSNVNLSNGLENGDTVGGVVLSTGDRVLLYGQSSSDENGIYVAVASGAASRSTDADEDSEVTNGMTVFVAEGTDAGKQFTLTTADPIVVDTTGLTFTQTGGDLLYTGDGTTIEKSGNQFNVVNQGIDTAQLADDAVTYAKMQNVSATNRILGRDTAGAGVVEEIAEAAFKSMFNLEIGTDVQAWDTDLDAYASNPLSSAELDQLQNIDSVTINNTQWGYLGGAGATGGAILQDATVNDVLGTLGLSTNLPNLTDSEVSQLENIDSVTIDNAQWGYVGGMDQGVASDDDVMFGDLVLDGTFRGNPSELTINSGTITVDRTYHTVDTQADAVSDDLDTIAGGTTGQIVWLTAENTTRTVVIKHGTGNIRTSSNADISLDSTDLPVYAIFDGSNWIVDDTAGNVASHTLGSHSDVTITSVVDNEILAYDSGGDWINQTPNEAGIVDFNTAQTLTNKTIDADNNTISNLEHGAEVDDPSSGVHGVTGSVVGTTDSQTLTNKTIAAGSNTISGLQHGTHVDDPSSGVHGVTGNVVGTTDSQTLTNKTLTSPVVGTQITLDQTTDDYTITWDNPAAARAYNIPDVGGAADFLFTAGSQNVTGTKSFGHDTLALGGHQDMGTTFGLEAMMAPKAYANVAGLPATGFDSGKNQLAFATSEAYMLVWKA
jgi:hypothetical protein